MILRAFILADAVTFTADGKYFIHGGGVDRIFAAHFPWTHPQLAAFVTLVPEADDVPGSDRHLEIEFVDEDDQPIEARIGGNFRIPPSDASRGRFPTVHFNGNFVGVAFREPGVYWVRALVDHQELGRLPLTIEERQTGEWTAVTQPSESD